MVSYTWFVMTNKTQQCFRTARYKEALFVTALVWQHNCCKITTMFSNGIYSRIVHRTET